MSKFFIQILLPQTPPPPPLLPRLPPPPPPTPEPLLERVLSSERGTLSLLWFLLLVLPCLTIVFWLGDAHWRWLLGLPPSAGGQLPQQAKGSLLPHFKAGASPQDEDSDARLLPAVATRYKSHALPAKAPSPAGVQRLAQLRRLSTGGVCTARGGVLLSGVYRTQGACAMRSWPAAPLRTPRLASIGYRRYHLGRPRGHKGQRMATPSLAVTVAAGLAGPSALVAPSPMTQLLSSADALIFVALGPPPPPPLPLPLDYRSAKYQPLPHPRSAAGAAVRRL